jgi:hypothetical protein
LRETPAPAASSCEEKGARRWILLGDHRPVRLARCGYDRVSESGAPSRTAMLTATIRGWHLFQHGRRAVLADWFGWPLVGGEAEELLTGLLAALATPPTRLPPGLRRARGSRRTGSAPPPPSST